MFKIAEMTLQPLHSLDRDWFSRPLSPPAISTFTLLEDSFLFLAKRSAPSLPHPSSEPNQFQEGLWESDVGELFLLEPESGRYLEINLAPNGAWWACWHSGVRQREEEQPSFDGIEAQGTSDDHGWEASISLPFALFAEPQSLRYNITFILNSPAQTFHSLAELPGEQPDFHQPQFFLPLTSQVPS